MPRFAYLLSMLLTACSTPQAPGYYPRAASPAPSDPSTPPAAPPSSQPPMIGVLRTEGQSTLCSGLVAVHPDGGATVMCTFRRENGCGLRQLGPDGEERGRSELAPGSCERWVPRGDGGGYLITQQADSYKELMFTALDPAGKRGASTSLTSNSGVFASDAHAAADGGLVAAVIFRDDLSYRGKRLGKALHGVSAIVRFPASLDRAAWSRVFGTRRTQIASLLPATQAGGIDAVLETRGPLVPGAPMHPKVNPEDGSIYGGDTYGWRAEHVEFDKRGTARARHELSVGPRRTVMDAAIVDGTLATLGRDPNADRRNIVTFARGERDKMMLGLLMKSEFAVANGRTWLIDVESSRGNNTGSVSTWTAHEVGGARRKLALTGALGTEPVRWTAIGVHDGHVVAIGTAEDSSTGTPLSFTAFAQLSPSAPGLDLATLAPVNRLVLASTCLGPRTEIADRVARTHQADAELTACGVPRATRAELSLFPDGGIGKFSITDASAEVIACARRVVDPVFVCPVQGFGAGSILLRP